MSRRGPPRLPLALLLAAATMGGGARAGEAPGDRIAAGQALFAVRCGVCHAPGGTGTFMLGRRLGADRALLAERTDLGAALVEHVVRHGINGMPVFTRVELTDAELAQVVAYLTRPAAARVADAPPVAPLSAAGP